MRPTPRAGWTPSCILSGLLLTLMMAGLEGALMRKTWDYTFISLRSRSEDVSAIHWDVRVEMVRRGTYALSGTVLINVDVADGYYLEVLSYRSATGNNDYRQLPFKVPRRTVAHYMATSYKDLVMETLAGCSDLPQAQGQEPPVLERKLYTLRRCEVSTEKFPSHLVPGFYKLVFNGTGPVGYVTEIVLKVNSKY